MRVLRSPAVAGLTAVGLVLRILAAAGHSAHVSADQRAYSLLGIGISEHGHYAAAGLKGQFHWPPGAPFLFALANLVHPAHHVSSVNPHVPAAYVAQVIVGTLTIPAAAWVAHQAAGRWAAIAAAAAVALYPPLVLSAGELLSEPLGALLVTLAVGAAAWGVRRPGLERLIPCGVLLGLTILTRADLLLAPLVLAAVIALWRRREVGWRNALATGGIVLISAFLTTVPWLAFVASQKNQLAPITTGGGSNLFIGTYLPGHGTIFGLKHALASEVRAHDRTLRATPTFKIPATKILLYVARGHRANADSYLRDRGLNNIWHYGTQRPVAFVRMLGSKVGRLWGDYTHGSLHPSRTLPRIGHVVLVLGALAALLAALWLAPSLELALIAALLALSTLSNAFLVSEARHLLPLLPLLFAGGAAGVARVLGRRRRAAPVPAAPEPVAAPS